eukprot:3591027-Amphidinium_carterae.2
MDALRHQQKGWAWPRLQPSSATEEREQGHGRMKHLEVKFLWLQQVNAQIKIPRTENSTDFYTKGWEAHMARLSLVVLDEQTPKQQRDTAATKERAAQHGLLPWSCWQWLSWLRLCKRLVCAAVSAVPSLGTVQWVTLSQQAPERQKHRQTQAEQAVQLQRGVLACDTLCDSPQPRSPQ